jgi:hypothetical protein
LPRMPTRSWQPQRPHWRPRRTPPRLQGQAADVEASTFAARLSSAGFEDEIAYTAAKLVDEQIALLDQQIERHQHALAAAIERAGRAEAAGAGVQQPDMQWLGGAAAEAQWALEAVLGTLSGGETFLAALSLALGLADVVQSYAGGIRLDTIFIDEGFGSLDTDALDDAMRALVDLQQAGRLVGIISHMPELKERIDVRLEITSENIGSKAVFRCG